jgi:hypothetical protein
MATRIAGRMPRRHRCSELDARERTPVRHISTGRQGTIEAGGELLAMPAPPAARRRGMRRPHAQGHAALSRHTEIFMKVESRTRKFRYDTAELRIQIVVTCSMSLRFLRLCSVICNHVIFIENAQPIFAATASLGS